MREDIYGQIITPASDVVYAVKGRLRMLRVVEVHDDRLIGFSMSGRRVTVRSDVALCFGWDKIPQLCKRRGRL